MNDHTYSHYYGMGGREGRVSFWLSRRFQKFIVFGTLRDIDNYYFQGKGYKITLQDFEECNIRKSKPYSTILLSAVIELVDEHNDYCTAHSICVAFSIPLYHVIKFLPRVSGENFLNFCLVVPFDVPHYTAQNNKLLMHTGFKCYKNAVERSFWLKHDYEIYCLVRLLTEDFMYYIDGEDENYFYWNGLNVGRRWLIPTFERIKTILKNVFGSKYGLLLGKSIAPSVLNAYLILHDYPSVSFVYKKNKIHSGTKRLFKKNNNNNNNNNTRGRNNYFDSYVNTDIGNKLRWFIGGTYGPYTAKERLRDAHKEVPRHNFTPNFLCKVIVNPETKYTAHINVQVTHVKIVSKEIMLYDVSGKSLAHTMSKKKTMSGSSYKTIKPDYCLSTPNTINFNIQGYDLGLILAILLFKSWKKICACDKSEPASTSHCRYSSNSLQNGLLDTNDYRYKMMIKYPTRCVKVPHFPVVDVCDVGLLHRESLLFNLNKTNPLRDINGLYGMIKECSEKDSFLEDFIYSIEVGNKELMDNHVLGMIKTLYALDLKELARKIPHKLKYDRLLIAFNPKTTKSEFADKSKFDSESKGKASKKIKIVDPNKSRKNFLKKIESLFPDVFIDPTNANSRGKWSYLDKLNHSSDRFFYSDFAKFYVKTLRKVFNTNSGNFKRTNFMLLLMQDEMTKYDDINKNDTEEDLNVLLTN